MDLLPIGSIIEKKGIRLVIFGYGFSEKDKIIPCYYVSLYPMGFVNSKSIALLPMNSEFTIVKEGYKDESFERYAEVKVRQCTVLDGIGESDIEKIYQKILEVENNNE